MAIFKDGRMFVFFHVQAVVGLAQVLAVGPIDPYYVCLYSIYTTGFRK